MDPKIYYRVHEGPPLVCCRIQKDPVYILPSHYFNIHFNIILPPKPREKTSIIKNRQ